MIGHIAGRSLLAIDHIAGKSLLAIKSVTERFCNICIFFNVAIYLIIIPKNVAQYNYLRFLNNKTKHTNQGMEW